MSPKILKSLSIFRTTYLRSWAVLVLDTVVTVACTMIVYVSADSYDAGFSRRLFFWVMLIATCVDMCCFYVMRTYRSVIRFATINDLWRLYVAAFFQACLMGGVFLLLKVYEPLIVLRAAVILLLLSICALTGVRMAMGITYEALLSRASVGKTSIIIYGTDIKSMSLRTRLLESASYNVVGFLTPDAHRASFVLRDLKSYGFTTYESFVEVKERLGFHAVLFPNYKAAHREKDHLIEYCKVARVRVLINPHLNELGNEGKVPLEIRPITIDDLLGRDEINIDIDAVRQVFRDKTVFVSGAAGSIGSEFCRQIASVGVRQLVLYDNAETPIHNLRLELQNTYPFLNFTVFVGDVRNRKRLDFLFDHFRPDIVFHAAAYKHVPLMEENPCEAMAVNVEGTRNMADAALRVGTQRFIFLSTDKAVNPTSVMGASKRIAEMYVQSLGQAVVAGKVSGCTRFVTTRFGNVLGSSGSVIPLFREQIRRGGPVTVTDARITRFFMSIPEACRLIMEAATLGMDNEIMVFDMGEPVHIDNLARRMIELAGYEPNKDITIKYIGLRPGEKLYEEVLNDEENTVTTSHPKIRIATVRRADYAQLIPQLDNLAQLAGALRVDDMLALIKSVVPEYNLQIQDENH